MLSTEEIYFFEVFPILIFWDIDSWWNEYGQLPSNSFCWEMNVESIVFMFYIHSALISQTRKLEDRDGVWYTDRQMDTIKCITSLLCDSMRSIMICFLECTLKDSIVSQDSLVFPWPATIMENGSCWHQALKTLYIVATSCELLFYGTTDEKWHTKTVPFSGIHM